MIWAWLSKPFLGSVRWVFVLLAVVLFIGALVALLVQREKADDEANQEIGRTEERVVALEKTVQRVEEANDVREEVQADVRRGGSVVLYCGCLSANRGAPENCVRFLPPGSSTDTERPTCRR